MGDLTLKSFAYLRVPLVVTGIAFPIGASAPFLRWPSAAHVLTMVLFLHAARLALLNGRQTNLEYGSNAPDAPRVFIDDADFARLWLQKERYYRLAEGRRSLATGSLFLRPISMSSPKTAASSR
jgi:hypothetical protein